MIIKSNNIKRADLLHLKAESQPNECSCCTNGKKINRFKVKPPTNAEKDNIFLNAFINNFDVRISIFFFRWKLNIFLRNRSKRCRSV